MRLGGGVPKALRLLLDQPVVTHAVRRVLSAASVGCVVVVAPPGYESQVQQALADTLGEVGWRDRLVVIPGGANRQQSVAAGLAAVPPEFEIVLVHDAARALAPGRLVEDVAAAVRGSGSPPGAGAVAVIPVLPVADTISQVDPAGQVVATPDRSRLRAVQTPQGFRREVLAAAHAAADPVAPAVTDDAGLAARLGHPVQTIPGSAYAMKITTRHDLLVAEALLRGEPPDPS
ncbi:MAG: 2-C-methyl-D-erythritol 4-phosphate cytidylyltransferase [Micromonosporaceae bacterium]|nr:2-C-methyl-D-erythritol 4-phosphate cytidylyltransferase [Micromonosporaceae bacterium]